MLDRSRPPVAGSPSGVAFPRFSRHRLANGLEILALPSARVPLVELEVVAPAGAEREAAHLAGLATLVAGMLDEGSHRRSGLELALAVEQMGATLLTNASWDSATAAIELRQDRLGAGLELLAELLTEPSFPTDEVERLRGERLSELLRRRDQSSFLADMALLELLYGTGAIYGRSVLGSQASVASLDRGDLLGFYQQHYSLAGCSLVAAGAFEPEALLSRLEQVFGHLPANLPAPAMAFAERPASARRIRLLDRPSAAQTELRLGRLGVARLDSDFQALRLLSTLLGGRFSSRLNLNLRERLGLTYSVSSAIASRRGPAPFQIQMAVANDGVELAVRETLGEVARLSEERVRDDEMTDTLDYLIGVLPYTMQSASDLVGYLETLVVFGLPDDYFSDLPRLYRSLTTAQLQEVAQRHLRADELAIVAVGPAAELEAQLAPFGDVEVVAASSG
jgi:zinc protease